MSQVKAQILERNGRKEFAVLPYGAYVQMQRDLEDYADLRALRDAKASESEASTLSLSEVRAALAEKRTRSTASKPGLKETR